MTQYDKFAKKYEEWMETPLKKYAWRETVKKNLKDIEGKRVLDVACGTGQSAEILYELGAKEVVGVDISEEQIRIAQKKLPETKFVVGDISKESFDELGEFDVITAIFLFEYAPTKQELENMVENIFKRLKLGGIFYSLTPDPIVDPKNQPYPYYGITGKTADKEGGQYTYILHNEKEEPCHPVEMYYWTLPTIKASMEQKGFTSFEKLPVFVSNEGIEKYGKEYWEKFFQNPVYLIFKAEK